MRALSIVLGVMLVLSLAGNAVLGVVVGDFNRQILSLQGSVNQKQTRINELIAQYNDAINQIKVANEIVATQQEVITMQQNDISRLQAAEVTYKRDLNNYRDRLSKADYFVSRAKCSVMVDELKAYAANRNEDVRASIINAHNQMYAIKSASSQWITMWDNSKSAVLQVFSTANTSARFVVSWTYDDSAIQTIYDVNTGCIMYTGDR
jgi:chromosome segregation ATPase